VFSPQRWARGSVELLDDPASDAGTVIASLRDVARINFCLGGRHAAVARLDELFRAERPGAALSLLDVGTGLGDIPAAAARRARERGLSLHLLGVERHPAAARAAQGNGLRAVIAEGGRLPFADGAVDYALCSLLLHHFAGAAAEGLVRELDRVARRGVVIADLRRSVLAASGFYLASFALRVQPVTRRDGVISVFRGFSAAELANLCRAAGVEPDVRRHPLFRLTAAWRPAGRSP